MSPTVILFTVFIGIAEMCGNVHQTGGTISSPSSPQLYDATVEFHTNTTTDSDVDNSKIEPMEYKELLTKAKHDLTDGTDGNKVLKYTFTTKVECKPVEEFAEAAKAANQPLITKAIVNCNGNHEF